MTFVPPFQRCHGGSYVGNNITSFQDGVPRGGFRLNNINPDYNERMHSIMRDGDLAGGLLPHPQFQNQRVGFMQTNRQCNNVNQNFVRRGLGQNTQIENGQCFNNLQPQNTWHGKTNCMRQINDHVNNFDSRNFQNCRQDNPVFVNDFIGGVHSGSNSHYDDGRDSIRNKPRINKFKRGQKNKLHLDRNGDFHHGRVLKKINTKRNFSPGRLGHNQFKNKLSRENSDCGDKNLIENSKSECEHLGTNHYSQEDAGSPGKVEKYPRDSEKFTDRLGDKRVFEIVDDRHRERSNSHRSRDRTTGRNRGEAKETSAKWHTERSYEKQDRLSSGLEQFSDRSSVEKYCRSSNSEHYSSESKRRSQSDRSSEERYSDRSRAEQCANESKTEQYLDRSSTQHCDRRYSSEHYSGRSSSSERYSSRSSAERFNTENCFDKSSAEPYIDISDKEQCFKRSFDKGLIEEQFDGRINSPERSYTEEYLNKSNIEEYQEKSSSDQHPERHRHFEVNFNDNRQRHKSEDRFHRSRQDRFQKHFRGRGRGFRLSRSYSTRSFYHRHKFSSDISRMSHKRPHGLQSPESIPRKKGKFSGNIENEERRKSVDIKMDRNDDGKKLKRMSSSDDRSFRDKHRKVEISKKLHVEKSHSSKDKLLKKHSDKHLKERNHSSDSKSQTKSQNKSKRKLTKITDNKTSTVEAPAKDADLIEKSSEKECEGREKVLSANQTTSTEDKSPSKVVLPFEKSSEIEKMKMDKNKDIVSDCTSSSLSKSSSSEMAISVTKPSSLNTNECTSSKTEADTLPVSTGHIDMLPQSASTAADAVTSKKGETVISSGVVDMDLCSVSSTSAPSKVMDVTKQARTAQENPTTKLCDGLKASTERNAALSCTSKQSEKSLKDSSAKAKSIANNQFKTVEKILCREKELPTLPKIQKKTKSSDTSTKTALEAAACSSKTAEKGLKTHNTNSQSDKTKKSSKHNSSKSEHRKSMNSSKQACDKNIKSSSSGKETSSKTSNSSSKLVKSSEDQETVSKSLSDNIIKPVKSSIDKHTVNKTNETPKTTKSPSVDKETINKCSGEMAKLVKSSSVEKELSNKASISKSKPSKHHKPSLEKSKAAYKVGQDSEKSAKSSKVMEKDLSSSKSECVPTKKVDRTMKSVEIDTKSNTPTKPADRTKSSSVERDSQKSDSKLSSKHGDKVQKSTDKKSHAGLEKSKSENETLRTYQQVPTEFDDMLPQLVRKSKRRDRISPKGHSSVKGSPQKESSEKIDKENVISRDTEESSGSESDHVGQQSSTSADKGLCSVVSESVNMPAQVVKVLKTDCRRNSADDILRHGNKVKSKTLLRKSNSYDGKEGKMSDISFDQSKHDKKQEKSNEQGGLLSKISDELLRHRCNDKSLEVSTENEKHLKDHSMEADQMDDDCLNAVPVEDSVDHRETETALVKGISSSTLGNNKKNSSEGKSNRERNFFDDFQLHDEVNPFSEKLMLNNLNETKHNVMEDKHKEANDLDRPEMISPWSAFSTPSVLHKPVTDKNTNHSSGEKKPKKPVKGSSKENRKRKHSGKENFDQEKHSKKDKLESKGHDLSVLAENCDKHNAVDNLEVSEKEHPRVTLKTNTSQGSAIGSVSALSDITELSDTSLVPLVMSTPIAKSAAMQSTVDKTSRNDMSYCSPGIELPADNSERVLQTNEDEQSVSDHDIMKEKLLDESEDDSSDNELEVFRRPVDSESKSESKGDQGKGENSSASYLSSFENISDAEENGDNCDNNNDNDSSSSDNEDDNRLFIDYNSPNKCEKQTRDSNEKRHSSTSLIADNVTSSADKDGNETRGLTKCTELKEMDSTFPYGQTSSHSSEDLPGSMSELGEEINSKEFEDIPDNSNSSSSRHSSESSVSVQGTEGIQTSLLGHSLPKDQENRTCQEDTDARHDFELFATQKNQDNNVLDSNNFESDVGSVKLEVEEPKCDSDNVHSSHIDHKVEQKADSHNKQKENNTSSFLLTPKLEPMDFEDISKSQHSNVVNTSLGKQLSVGQSNSCTLDKEGSDATPSSEATELSSTTTMTPNPQIKQEKDETVGNVACFFNQPSACSEGLDNAGAHSAEESIVNSNTDSSKKTTLEPSLGVTSDQEKPEKIENENNQDYVDLDFDEDEIDDSDIRLMIYIKGVPQSPWTPMPPTPCDISPSDEEEFEPESVLADLESQSNKEARSDSEGSCVPSSQPNSPDCEELGPISTTEDLDRTQIYTTDDNLPVSERCNELMTLVQQNSSESVLHEGSSQAVDHKILQTSEDLQQLQSHGSVKQPAQSSLKIVSVDSLHHSMSDRLNSADESAPSDKIITTSMQNLDNVLERLTSGATHEPTDNVGSIDLTQRLDDHVGSSNLTHRSTDCIGSLNLTSMSTDHVGSSDLIHRSTEGRSSNLTSRSTDHVGSSNLTSRSTNHVGSSELTHRSADVGSSNTSMTSWPTDRVGSSNLTPTSTVVGSSNSTSRSTDNVGSSDLTSRSTDHVGLSDLIGTSTVVGSSNSTSRSTDNVGSSDLTSRSTDHVGLSDLIRTSTVVGSSNSTSRSTDNVGSSDLACRPTENAESSDLTPEEAAALQEMRGKSTRIMEVIKGIFKGFDKAFFIDLEHYKIYEGGVAINTRASYYPQFLLRRDWRCIICQSCQACFSPLGFACHTCQRTSGYSSALKLNEYETLKRAFVRKPSNCRVAVEKKIVQDAWTLLTATRTLEYIYCTSVDKTCKINKKAVARVIMQTNRNIRNGSPSSSGRDSQEPVRQASGPVRSSQPGAVKQGPVSSTAYQLEPGSLPQTSVAQRTFQQESISQIPTNSVPITKPSGLEGYVPQRPHSLASLHQESVPGSVGRRSSVPYQAPQQGTSRHDSLSQVQKSLSGDSSTLTNINPLQHRNPTAAAGVRDSGRRQPPYNNASHNILKDLLQLNSMTNHEAPVTHPNYPSQQWPHAKKSAGSGTQVSSVGSVEGLPSSTNANLQFLSSQMHVTSTVAQNSQTVTNSTSTSVWNPFDTLPELSASNLSNLSSLTSTGISGHNNFIPQNQPYSQPQQFKVPESRPVNVHTTSYAASSSNQLGSSGYTVNRPLLPKSHPNHLLRLLNQNLDKEQNVVVHDNTSFRQPNRPSENYMSQTSNDMTQNTAQSQLNTSRAASQHLPSQAASSSVTVQGKSVVPGQQVTAEELLMITHNLCQRPTGMNQNLNQRPTEMNQNLSQGPSGMNQNLTQVPSGISQNLSQRPTQMNQNLSQGRSGMNQNLTQVPSGISQNLSQRPTQMNQNLRQGPSGMNQNSRQGPTAGTQNLSRRTETMTQNLSQGLEMMTKNMNEETKKITQNSSQSHGPSTETQNYNQGSLTVSQNSVQKPALMHQLSRQDFLIGSQISNQRHSPATQNFTEGPTALSQNVGQEIMHKTCSSSQETSVCQSSSQQTTAVSQNRRPSTETQKSNVESSDSRHSANGLASDVILEMDDIMRDFQEGVSKQVRAMTRMQKLVRDTNDMMDRNQKQHDEEIKKYKDKEEKMEETIRVALETIKYYMNEEGS